MFFQHTIHIYRDLLGEWPLTQTNHVMGSNSSLGALALTFVILEIGRHLQVQRHVEARSLSRLTNSLIESLPLPKALRDIHSRNIGNFKSPGGKEKKSLNNPWPNVSLFAPGQRSLQHSCHTPSE